LLSINIECYLIPKYLYALVGVPVLPGLAFIGEIGLGGEVRGGKGLESKAKEAIKMGVKSVVAPRLVLSARSKHNRSSSQTSFDINFVKPCSNIKEALCL
jgi:predicted ATP-dependent serine protease